MAKYYRVSFNAHERAVRIATVVHVKADGEPVLTGSMSIDTVADNVQDWLRGLYQNMLTTNGAIDSIVVREELAPGSAVPAQTQRTGVWNGVRTVDEHLDMQICAHVKASTDAAVRSGHGGFFGTPARDRGAFNGDDGTLLPLNPYAVAVKAFADALVAGHGVGTLGSDGHLAYVIYSRTRRARGASDYAFGVTSTLVDARPHFLRSRKQ